MSLSIDPCAITMLVQALISSSLPCTISDYKSLADFLMEVLDADKNGKISVAEVLATVPVDDLKTELLALFDKFDVDKDGEINTEELITMLKAKET
ncbi:unnamed protein product [Echinostoma caproni]|uniref:EF-hand domain-containing protein n=1 Tax=Echinostoma caproni TaxID=27848 RepID=A0A183ALE9_9TREM|nr:unnamed protein product [Echinostoma caproni]